MIWLLLIGAGLVVWMIAWGRNEDRIEREYRAGCAAADARYLARLTELRDRP